MRLATAGPRGDKRAARNARLNASSAKSWGTGTRLRGTILGASIRAVRQKVAAIVLRRLGVLDSGSAELRGRFAHDATDIFEVKVGGALYLLRQSSLHRFGVVL